MGVQIQLKQTDFVDSKAYSNLRDCSCNSVLTNKDDIVIHAEGGRHCHKKNPSKNEIDYNMIVNKPSINGHILLGDMSSEDLGLCTKENAYADIKRVKDYVYEIYYNELDYDFAYDYFAKSKPVEPVGACSAIRNGNFYGRNLDWIYNEDAEFIVRVPRIANRYASMGIAGSISGLTDEIVKSKVYSSLYKLVPFKLLDGINENGVVINTNVVPTDKGINYISKPIDTVTDIICGSMLPRYVLDNFATAQEATDYIQQHVAIYPPKQLVDMGYEAHWIIADENNTFLIEIIDEQVVITDMTEGSNSILAGKSYMTNFYLSDIVLNNDDKVYTPETQDEEHNPIDDNNITPDGCGLERYNIIVDGYDNANTLEGMRSLLNQLTYTKAYKADTTPVWYTEFVGINGLNVNSTPSEYAPVIAKVREMFDKRTRQDNTTWQTTHSVIYDIENREMHVIFQEDGIELTFNYRELQPRFTKQEVLDLISKEVSYV